MKLILTAIVLAWSVQAQTIQIIVTVEIRTNAPAVILSTNQTSVDVQAPAQSQRMTSTQADVPVTGIIRRETNTVDQSDAVARMNWLKTQRTAKEVHWPPTPATRQPLKSNPAVADAQIQALISGNVSGGPLPRATTNFPSYRAYIDAMEKGRRRSE